MKPHSLYEEDQGYVTGYMCLTDFECELGGATHGNTIYPSLESLRKHRSCLEECGIAEVRVTGVRIVQEPKPLED